MINADQDTVDSLKTIFNERIEVQSNATKSLENSDKTDEFNCNAAHIINLDRSVERWQNIVSQFEKSDQPYQRFKAIDGYNIVFRDIYTEENFIGLDLKNGIVLNQDSIYQINCTPNNLDPVIFYYQGKSLTAGEYGCYCGHITLWYEAKKHQCKNTIVLEDDIEIKGQNLHSELSKLITTLPEDYDISLLDKTHLYYKTSNHHTYDDEQDMFKLEKTDSFYGTHAYIISDLGTNKLVSMALFTNELDVFISEINEELHKPYQLNLYIYLEDLVTTYHDTSEIHEMGRNS